MTKLNYSFDSQEWLSLAVREDIEFQVIAERAYREGVKAGAVQIAMIVASQFIKLKQAKDTNPEPTWYGKGLQLGECSGLCRVILDFPDEVMQEVNRLL